MNKRPDAPCYKCPDREIGCHSKCDRYKEFKARLISRNTKINRNQMFCGEAGDIVKVEVARHRAKQKEDRRLKGK